MPCFPKCLKTASLSGPGGHRIMINPVGNEKFPIPHTPHPQCAPCAADSCAEALGQIAKTFPNSEIGLNARFEKFKSKFKGG